MLYSTDELTAISPVCGDHGVALHMDGVQLARPGRPPLPRRPETSVDVLLLGATKNGALSADAVVFLIWTRLWILNFVVSEAIICSQKCGFCRRNCWPVWGTGAGSILPVTPTEWRRRYTRPDARFKPGVPARESSRPGWQRISRPRRSTVATFLDIAGRLEMAWFAIQ